MNTSEINNAILIIAATPNKKDAIEAHKIIKAGLPNCKITKLEKGSWIIENTVTGSYIIVHGYGFIQGSYDNESEDPEDNLHIRTKNIDQVDVAQTFIDWNKKWHTHPECLYSHDSSNNCTIVKWGEPGYLETDYPEGKYDDDAIDELNAKRWFDGNILRAKRVRNALERCSIAAQNNPDLNWDEHYELCICR